MVKPGDPPREPRSRTGAISNACRKLLRIKPQSETIKKGNSPLVRSLVRYLTADSFMYGPLLTPPSPPQSPQTKSVLQKPNESFDLPGPASPVAENQGASALSSLHSPPSTPISRLRSMSTITKRILGRVTPERIQKRATIVPSPFDIHHKASQVPSPIHKEKSEVNRNGFLTSQGEDEEDANITNDENESSKSLSESLSEQNVVALNYESATEVARRVVRKVGGRFSKELGIFVDGRDSEVERWFLVTTFLHQPSDFELSKQMFKKLQSMGISNIQDVLGRNPTELDEAFKSVMHNHRSASRLRKIALDLHTLYGSGICVLKRVPEYLELKRDLERLSGYSKPAASTFMREMRGVWAGASPDFDVRARNAAKHLHLLSSNQDATAATATLVELGEEAGLDVRDLEVALLRVSAQHARHYRNCPGGRDCEYSRITLSDVDQLIANL